MFPQVGYQVTLAKFWVFWAIVLLLGLISETLGILCSIIFHSQLLGAIILQGLYVPLLMFVGFFQVIVLSCVVIQPAKIMPARTSCLHRQRGCH